MLLSINKVALPSVISTNSHVKLTFFTKIYIARDLLFKNKNICVCAIEKW